MKEGGFFTLYFPSGKQWIAKQYSYPDNYMVGGTSDTGFLEQKDLVYVGYGVTAPELGYDSYKGVDVKGKIVVCERDVPYQGQDPKLQKAWNTSFNLTTTRNRVTKLAEGIDNITTGSYNITMVGKSIGQLYLYPSGGIDENTGRRIFYGSDGTKVLCMYEKSGKFFTEDGKAYAESNLQPVVCGNTLPTYYGGWSNNFRYKSFDMSVMFQFSGGNKIYNGTKATCADMRYWNNTIDVLNHYWSESNKNATYAYPIYGDNYSNGSAKPISDWVENGDYLRCKNLSLGYTFDTKKWPKAIGISSLRVYAQAQNLFVITGYSGLDPEASTMESDDPQSNLVGFKNLTWSPNSEYVYFNTETSDKQMIFRVNTQSTQREYLFDGELIGFASSGPYTEDLVKKINNQGNGVPNSYISVYDTYNNSEVATFENRDNLSDDKILEAVNNMGNDDSVAAPAETPAPAPAK